jgi:hypothetical protein
MIQGVHSKTLGHLSILLVLACNAGWATDFIRGDANGDGQVDLSDPVKVLVHLFVGGSAAPGCLAAADADGSGDVVLTDAIYSLDYLFLGGFPPPAPFPDCGADPDGDEGLPCLSYDPSVCPPAPSGRLVQASDCGGFKDRMQASSDECVEYSYAGTTLALRHINAAFNCCPKEITIEVRVNDGTIDIVEYEAEAGCRCNCLYDLDLVVENLPAGTYRIRTTGPIGPGLDFTVDLAAQPSGSYCEKRQGYPWDGTEGRLVAVSDCGGFGAMDDSPVDLSLECMEYSFEGGTLKLRHVNAGFNCCGAKSAQVTVADGEIRIVESEEQNPCDCECLFDLDMEVVNLPAGTYRILVTGSLGGLDFVVDLAAQPSGSYCEKRDRYPWHPGEPRGWLNAVSDCGGFGEEAIVGANSSEECMRYSIDGNTLWLRHGNAGFNCCGEKSAQVTVTDGEILIAESEEGAPCMCECLFDLDMVVVDIPAGTYRILVTGSLGGLDFVVDLVEEPSGSYCEKRDRYPWGM